MGEWKGDPMDDELKETVLDALKLALEWERALGNTALPWGDHPSAQRHWTRADRIRRAIDLLEAGFPLFGEYGKDQQHA